MEFTIAGRHFEITDAIHDYVEKKMDRLERHYDRVHKVHIVISQPESRGYDVELIVSIAQHDPVIAHGKGDDLYACIDSAIDRGERQLTDLKEKLKNHKFTD